MKHIQFLALLCSFVCLLSSCKKDGDTAPTTDPRDAFVGTYQVTYSGNCGGGAATLIVRKGISANELLFTDAYKADYPVNLSGNSFSIPTYIQLTTIDGYTVSISVFGNGSFNNGAINYTETSKYGPPENYICTAQVIGTK